MTRKTKLLVVEDRDNERRALARLLSMEGYETLTAKDANDALAHVAEGVDLVITDLKMPETSGVELLERWKARRPATPFIMVTAFAEVDSAVKAMKLGAKDYLTKPIKPDEFLDLVARVVQSSAAALPAADHAEPAGEAASHSPANETPPHATRLEDLEKDAVLRALEREGGNRTHAARLLGISIRTLQRKLKAWGISGRDGDADDLPAADDRLDGPAA